MYFVHSKKIEQTAIARVKTKKGYRSCAAWTAVAVFFSDLSVKKTKFSPFLSDYISRDVRYNEELTPSPSSGNDLMNEFRRASQNEPRKPTRFVPPLMTDSGNWPISSGDFVRSFVTYT